MVHERGHHFTYFRIDDLMPAYILRRILMLFPTLLGVSIIVFLMLHITPGDPPN